MNVDSGDIKTMELLRELYGDDKCIKNAGYEELPEGTTQSEIEELQRKMNRHERRSAIAESHKQKKALSK